MKIDELDFCRRIRRRYPDPNTVICAGNGGKDTCRGDSGGPLILSNNVETKWFLVGITSIGPNVCGQENTQGIYTNVAHYKEWILSILQP